MSSDYTQISYRLEGKVAVVTIERPQKMNCIGPTAADELTDAWQRFKDDDDALVGVMTGAGEQAFCAGGDIEEWLDRENRTMMGFTPEAIEEHNQGLRPGVLGPTRWTGIHKPTIAAVNGLAYAGGLEWACWADIRVVDENASFGVTCRRWNIGLADGGTQRLRHIVGLGRALDLIITGRVIDAQEAERIGLANRVVPAGQSLAAALELAGQIAKLPQSAIHTDKEATIRGLGQPLDEALKIEAQCFNRLIDGEEIFEGARKFIERDHPDRQAGSDPLTSGIDRPLSG